MGALVLLLPLLLAASASAGVLQSDKCGVQHINPDDGGRITGGLDAAYGEFPWVAALHYTLKNSGLDGGIKCAGVIISNKFVLTAAHCLHLDKYKLNKVWLGVRRITEVDTNDVDKVKKFDILTSVIHEKYNAITGEHDIALLKLKGDIKFSDYIRKICLPPANAALPPSGTMLMVAGWGEIGAGESMSDNKLKVNVPLYSHDECESKLGHSIKPEQFCAEGERRKGTCFGDGGGPLMRAVPDGINLLWEAVGVISGTEGCGFQGRPVVHTRVSSYVNWIEQNLAKP